MWVFQTYLKSKRLRYTLKNIVKPNFIRTLRGAVLQNNSVGFHSVSGGCGVSGEKFVFSMTFTVLVESVQPNLRCYDAVFFTLTPMVRFATEPDFKRAVASYPIGLQPRRGGISVENVCPTNQAP